jgi:hypothetical protein
LQLDADVFVYLKPKKKGDRYVTREHEKRGVSQAERDVLISLGAGKMQSLSHPKHLTLSILRKRLTE